MIHFLCALDCEARPLIEHFGLRRNGRADRFPLYCDAAAEVALVVSGPGKLAAAAALMYAAERHGATQADAWINVGTAGHGRLAIGQAAIANRVEDAGSGRCWFPVRLFDCGVPSAAVLTLDRPSAAYGEVLYDLEASGFYDSACRVTTLEMAHCLKVVSDNRERPLGPPSEKAATALVAGAIDHVGELAGKLAELGRDLHEAHVPPPHFEAILGRWRFSEYQRRKLRRLLVRWQALAPDRDPLDGPAGGAQSAGALLNHLAAVLDRTVPDAGG